MRLFKKSEINDRGAAIHQKKSWTSLRLNRKTLFVHCGGAPFAQETTGLLRKYGKEVCTVVGTAETKFILCFPLLNMSRHMVPEVFTLAKPAQMLWEMDEMPRGFIFELPAGTEVWTNNGVLAENGEVGLAFDVIFEDCLVAQYQRINKATMQLKPLNGVDWL